MLATQFVEFLLVELSALPEFVHLLVNLLGVERRLLLLGDPVFYALAGALLEGYAEGAVAAVATAVGQLLGLDGLALGRLRAIGRKMRYEVYAKTGFSGDGRSLFLFLGTRPLRNWLHLVLSGWP